MGLSSGKTGIQHFSANMGVGVGSMISLKPTRGPSLRRWGAKKKRRRWGAGEATVGLWQGSGHVVGAGFQV